MTASASENFASRGSSRPRRAPTAATRAAPRSFPPVLGNTFDEMPRRASSLAPKTRERLAGHPDLEGFANALEADQSRLIKDVAQNRQKPHGIDRLADAERPPPQNRPFAGTSHDAARRTARLSHKRAPRRAPVTCWRRSPDSNRGSGLCRPVPYHLATSPYEKGRTRPAGKAWSGLRGSNPRPQPWQGCALPTALSPQEQEYYTGHGPTAQAFRART